MTYISNIARSEGDPKVLRSGPSSLDASDRLARALGWFSFGLGLAELVAPRQITRTLGIEGRESLVRACGAREIAHGILSLSTEKHVGVWSRVAGDALDLAALMSAMRPNNPKRDNVAAAMAGVLAITALDLVAAQGTSMRQREDGGQRRRYRDRTGFPKGLQSARGAARDFRIPRDFRAAPVLAAVSDRSSGESARPH